MKAKVYHFDLKLSWKILSVISRIDPFDASWSSIERPSSLPRKSTLKVNWNVGGTDQPFHLGCSLSIKMTETNLQLSTKAV
ncbi:MAG: hypothetical protein ACKV1O_12285 [Saprospiraceae bacterium]